MRRWIDRVAPLALLAAAATGLDRSAHAADVAVEVANASVPTLCAENDNVDLRFFSAAVRQFTVVAEHPAYAGTIVADRSAPDFRNCNMAGDPAFKAEPRRVTLYETGDLQLIGYTFPSFWRPNVVPVRVGNRVAILKLGGVQCCSDVKQPLVGFLKGRRRGLTLSDCSC